jgi:DNA-binding MarR family transcriptional regulator
MTLGLLPMIRTRLLAALEEWGPASQADLGRGTGIDRSDVTAALSELESRGLVERSVDPDHRRRKIVTITPAGIEQLLDLDKVIDRIQDQVLKPLTGAQRRQFLALMTKILATEDDPSHTTN